MKTRTTLLTLLAVCLMLVACDADTKNVDSCGDGFVDPGEECDGVALGGASCTSQGFYKADGVLACTSECRYDTTDCDTARCGDSILQPDREDCEGANLDGETCVSLGYERGTLACNATCSFDRSGCEGAGECGDNTIQTPEECDGNQLGGQTCASLGYYTGTLECGDDCQYDLGSCEHRCGDGTVDADFQEVCDGMNLNSQTCLTLGYSPRSGALSCTAGCEFNETACVANSTNADLATLTVNSGTLAPAFSASTTSYTVTVSTAVTTLTVAATKANTYASMVIAPSQPMTLSLGSNPATVTVTAESGAQKVYTVVITQTLDYASPNIGTLKYVPAGTFQRDETPSNLSTVSAFRMSQFEITRAQWTAVTGWMDPSNGLYSSGTNDPVQQVSLYDAIAFCNKLSLLEGMTPVYSVWGVDFSALTYAQIPTSLNGSWDLATANWAANGYRLPTEMEWMWAAMGADLANPGVTNTTGYSKAFAGSTGSNSIGDYTWYADNSGQTHPAGTKLPNELGLYDVSGNIVEWVWDWYGTYPTGTVTDYWGGSGTYRVTRGGSWNDAASLLTLANRGSYYGGAWKTNVIGFRVLRR